MSNEDILTEVGILKAHASLCLEVAERITKALQPVSTGSKKNKSGLSDTQKAKLKAGLMKSFIKRKKTA